jgi:Protein of unknown function (DUF3048) N-terminal domain/Protein of unknown function (DUF3048) C-terminal domain
VARFAGRASGWWWALPRWARIAGPATVAVVAAIAVFLAVLPPTTPRSPSAGPSPTPAPTPTPTPTPSPNSPLTGRPGPTGTLIAVKIDNVGPARPQTGLNAADVVYAIQVEGGLSRLLAVYDSAHLPNRPIGPVRSARESDLELMRQYGKPAFVYSGAQRPFLPVLAAADVVNCSPAQESAAYSRTRDRFAPHNEFVDLGAVLRGCPGASAVKDVGFRFGTAPAGGTPTAAFTARMPAATFTFTWSAARGEYLVSMDGVPAGTTDAGRVSAPTVVIQKVERIPSPRGLKDSSGTLTPFSHTVGSGEAVILRDGRAFTGSWSRPAADDPTVYTYRGERMTFQPGRVWVVLEPR